MEERCFCYEKFKDQLPADFKPKCFKEQCRNYRQNMKQLKEEEDTHRSN
ncbi:hypothetical protein [Halalkalibacillus sediminis]|nr:hypothetical protein [Halalkalibacillus sediminis]